MSVFREDVVSFGLSWDFCGGWTASAMVAAGVDGGGGTAACCLLLLLLLSKRT